MLGFAKTGACVSARQHFAGTLSAIARDLSLVRSRAKLARRASKSCAHVSKTGVFIHISLAIARVSAKEQQELAMCWRWGRVSKTYGSAIVIDTRTEGSKGFGHGSSSIA